MDIPETEKLDVNAPSALSRLYHPAIFLSHSSCLFFSLSISLVRVALTQRSNGKLRWSFPPFFDRRKGREKKNSLANFPSRTRALGQPPYETDVLPHFRVFSRLFALQSERRIKGAPRHLLD